MFGNSLYLCKFFEKRFRNYFPLLFSEACQKVTPVNLTFLDYRVIHFVIHFTPPTRYEGINLYVPTTPAIKYDGTRVIALNSM